MLLTGRLLSIVMLLLAFYFLRKILLKSEVNNFSIILFSFLFFVNAFLIDWSVVVKSYSLSILILSLCCFYFQNIFKKADFKNVILCSVFFSLLLLIKLSFAIVCGAYIGYLFYLTFNKNYSFDFKYLSIGIIAFFIPLLVFILVYIKHFDSVKTNLFDINFAMTEGYSGSSNLFKPVLFFLLPQNLILILIVLFSGFKYYFYEKFLLIVCGAFVIVHFFTQMLPEYFVPIIPLLCILSALRFNKFREKIIQYFKTKINLKRSVIVLYILSVPFGINHFKNLIEGKNLTLNPIQLLELNRNINEINGETILSSWEGYSVFSGKESLMKEYYVSAFLERSNYKREGIVIKTTRDYKKLINEKYPDIIVYDTQNPSHLEGSLSDIETNYDIKKNYCFLKIYSRKR